MSQMTLPMVADFWDWYKESLMNCVICKDFILPDANGWDGGHKAQPVAEGQCCGDCNDTLVTYARLRDAGYSSEQVSRIAPTIAEAR